MKTTKEQARAAAKAKRAELKQLSEKVKADEITRLLKAGDIGGAEAVAHNQCQVNELIRDYYRKQGHTELNTFLQWKEKGYKVIKGVKALLLWTKPIEHQHTKEVTDEETGETSEHTESYELYSYISLFSNLQVEKA